MSVSSCGSCPPVILSKAEMKCCTIFLLQYKRIFRIHLLLAPAKLCVHAIYAGDLNTISPESPEIYASGFKRNENAQIPNQCPPLVTPEFGNQAPVIFDTCLYSTTFRYAFSFATFRTKTNASAPAAMQSFFNRLWQTDGPDKSVG